MDALAALLAHEDFSELRHRRAPIFGEREGPANQPKVTGFRTEYQLAWTVAPGEVRWVHASSLADLPVLVAARAWR